MCLDLICFIIPITEESNTTKDCTTVEGHLSKYD